MANFPVDRSILLGSGWNVLQRSELGCPNEPKRLPDFGTDERRQKHSESAGIDHFSPVTSLVCLVAEDNPRSGDCGSDDSQGVPPRHAECSRLK